MGGKRILTHVLVLRVLFGLKWVKKGKGQWAETWRRWKWQCIRDTEAMKISTELTCPGHKRNQDSLNEYQAMRLTRTLIYFILPLYFISVSLDAANQQVFTEWAHTLCPAPDPALWGDFKLQAMQFAMSGVLTSSSRTTWELFQVQILSPTSDQGHQHIWRWTCIQGLRHTLQWF